MLSLTNAGSVQAAVEEAVSRDGESALVGLPSGQRVAARELMTPLWRGRKVVLLGDTCNSEAIMGAPGMPAAVYAS